MNGVLAAESPSLAAVTYTCFVFLS